MLYAPSDSEFQVDDPTMWFEKVEESDETTSESAINASAKMIMNIGHGHNGVWNHCALNCKYSNNSCILIKYFVFLCR